MLDINTPYKAKRGITIKITLAQNDQRDDIKAHIDVSEKLAPQGAIETSFAFGRNMKTGQIEVREYGKQIKWQMEFDATQPELKVVDTETCEIVENVVDLRKQ